MTKHEQLLNLLRAQRANQINIGKLLIEIHDSGEYKEYCSRWDDYCRKHLELDPGTAAIWMRVSTVWEPAKLNDATTLPITKLFYLSYLAEDGDPAEVLEWGRKSTMKQIMTKVYKHNYTKGKGPGSKIKGPRPYTVKFSVNKKEKDLIDSALKAMQEVQPATRGEALSAIAKLFLETVETT